MQLVMRHHQHHRTTTCVNTAEEHAVVASASWAMNVLATNKEDVTHDSHRRIDGQHYYWSHTCHHIWVILKLWDRFAIFVSSRFKSRFKHLTHIYLVNYQAVGYYCRSEVVYCHFATKQLCEMRFMYAATLTFSLSQVHPLILIVGMLHLSRNRIA